MTSVSSVENFATTASYTFALYTLDRFTQQVLGKFYERFPRVKRVRCSFGGEHLGY
jgi:hypothetical protein